MMAYAENDPRKAGTIWAVHIDEPRPIIKPAISATFRRLGPESTSPLAAITSGSTRDEIQQRFETGRRCYAAYVGNQLAAYGWVSFDEEYLGELNLRIRLLQGEAYIWDCYTLPPFRKNHLYSALLDYMIRQLQADLLCRVWIGANLDNIASQRGIACAGFRPVADMVVARVLAMRLVSVQGRPGIDENVISEVRRAFLNNRDQIWTSALRSVLGVGD
jgi:Acetyltransferase (GNAT) family